MPPKKPRKKHEPDAATLAFQAALGQRIRELRDEGYSQDDFAAKVDVFRSHMSRIEQGKTDLRLSTLLRIATALGMTVSELLDLPGVEGPAQPREEVR
ncbi:helix-turn-helix domain-containing protein [Deinococcus aestuarii]|uniref:helix-turn-helix domain-containing protein n=1 Tax=Deinococcus aestuarii TaxID=2774531 RepID=UPI001C0B8A96|nr:helix-turn-helix transcriptional regulator [Deinococcus aestuarii]